MYTGIKTGKNAFEGLNLKSFWSYAFFQYGGFFYGFIYTGTLITALSFATVDPADFWPAKVLAFQLSSFPGAPVPALPFIGETHPLGCRRPRSGAAATNGLPPGTPR